MYQPVVNLLLLLSALLSALTGVGTRAVAERPVAVMRAAASAEAAPRAVSVVAARPGVRLAGRRVALAVAIVPRLALLPITPIYFGRRRE